MSRCFFNDAKGYMAVGLGCCAAPTVCITPALLVGRFPDIAFSINRRSSFRHRTALSEKNLSYPT
jgi:hypothetical protein